MNATDAIGPVILHETAPMTVLMVSVVPVGERGVVLEVAGEGVVTAPAAEAGIAALPSFYLGSCQHFTDI